MDKTYIAAGLLVIGTVAVGIGVQKWPSSPFFGQSAQMAQEQAATSAPSGKYMGIEAYVTAFIAELSPVKAQVGGTFYVTSVEITGTTTGIVAYEDGHNAYTADFIYTIDPETARPQVTSFTVRE